MTDTNMAETEVEAGRFDWVGEPVAELYEILYPSVVSEDWTVLPLADQINLSENLTMAYEALGILRNKFDTTVYRGVESGRIDAKVTPVRAKPEFTSKPGKAAPSAADVLKRKLNKR